MFGADYQEREYNQFVGEGDYIVRLGMPQDIERAGYHIREIPIEIKGHRGYGPDKWSIFDADTSDEEKYDNWNKAMTRNADAFGIQRGDFALSSWRGKTGVVHIGKDSKGYMKVLWAIVQETPTTSQPAQVQKQAAPAKKIDEFPDDIPF